MNILNQKEEVVKVELTKHGRKLLGMGIFQPKYFSFFDDSIIYDNSYSGEFDEDTNNIQKRILDKSLTFSGINLLSDTLENQLGSSDITINYSPSWDIGLLKGSFSLSYNSAYYKKIFNFGNIIYNISLVNVESDPVVEEDYILIDLKELNVQDDLHNFEIEVITYDDITGNSEKRLKFSQNKTNIINGILYEESELPYNFFNVDINENDVGYYLDILVDDEIDTDFIISSEKKLQDKIKDIQNTYISNNSPDPCEPCCDTSTEPC